MSDELPPQLIRYGPPYGSEKLPELTEEEIEAISAPSLYLHSLKTIAELEARLADLEAAVGKYLFLIGCEFGNEDDLKQLQRDVAEARGALIEVYSRRHPPNNEAHPENQ